MTRLTPGWLLSATLAALVPLAGCDAPSDGAPRETRPLVVCTTTMITDLARQIAGERVRVVGIIPPGSDPHIYDATPDDSLLLRKARLILYNGLHLEGRMVQMIHSAGSRAVALAEDPRIRPRESALAKGAPDPHCWWDARHFMVYAERARDALMVMDPGGAEEYRARTARYVSALAEVDAQVRQAIEHIRPEHRYLITSHDAFYYYGSAYGLKVDAVLGISTDASVQALRIDELARLVVRNRIPAIFHETSVSAALNEMIDRVVELARREGHDVRVASEPLYSDSLGPPDSPAGTYIGALRENTRIIVSALAGPSAAEALRNPEGRP